MAKKTKQCAFCGQTKLTTREHVVPKGIFPPSVRHNMRPVMEATCEECNGSFSADEEDFRNFITLAGEPNEAVHELFKGPVLRALDLPEGKGSFRRLVAMMKFSDPIDHTKTRIYPNERTYRVLRKIVRGLSYHHHRHVTPDSCVQVQPLHYQIAEEYQEADEWKVVEPSVFRYVFMDRDLHEKLLSVWILQIFRNREYLALVSKEPVQP